MINTSKVITSIKMDLGVYGMNLPFDDSDEVLMNIIKIKTLPTFSQFSPYYVSFIVDSNDVKKSDDGTYNSKIFTLPDIFGDRDISISREITKKFETIYRGKISNVINLVPEKGEFVIVVSGCEEKVIDDNLSIKEAANLYIKAGLDVMTAIKKVAKDRKIPKNEVYKEYHKEEK